MSGGSSQQTQQLDPALRDAYLQNVQSAQGVAAGLAPRQFAGFNQDQLTGAQIYRNFADPNSEVFTGMRAAFDVAGQAANYQPQNVQYNAFRGARVDPAALAAQQGYNATTGQFSSAGPASQAASQGYTASQFGGAQAAPASLAQATGYTAERFGGQTAGEAAQAQAAQLAREAVRDVEAERIAAERIAADRVSGADVTSEALGQIAPQARQNVRDIQAASFLNQNIQQYMNPYTQAVTEQSLKDLERSRQLKRNRLLHKLLLPKLLVDLVRVLLKLRLIVRLARMRLDWLHNRMLPPTKLHNKLLRLTLLVLCKHSNLTKLKMQLLLSKLLLWQVSLVWLINKLLWKQVVLTKLLVYKLHKLIKLLVCKQVLLIRVWTLMLVR